MSFTLSKKAITLKLVGSPDSYQFKAGVDGNFICKLPSSGATIESYSSAFGSPGAVLNVRGYNEDNVHDKQIPQGTKVYPGDSLIVSATSVTNQRPQYWELPGGSVVAEMLAVCFVDYDIGDENIRPPAIGGGIMNLIRKLPIWESQIKWNLLPSIVDVDNLGLDWNAWGQGKPTLDYAERLFGDFCGEVYQGWGNAFRTPHNQNPGYGRDTASVVSQAFVLLCSKAPLEAKKRLARLMIQWGLDICGAHIDGRQDYTDGGHKQGLKALAMFALTMLGIKHVSVGNKFAEDMTFYKMEPKAWFFGWPYGYQTFHVEPRFLHTAPETWTRDVRGQVFAAGSYINHVCAAHVGTRLASKLIGFEDLMGEAFCGMMDQWMKGPPADADARMRSVGVNNHWGTDFAMVKGLNFCKTAYNMYMPV